MASVAFAAMWFWLLAPTGLGGPVGMVWVSGTSMEPGMHTGDLAVMYRRDVYDVGDVVAFDLPQGGTVIHRIIERTDAGFRFQGDNRDFPDPWVLDESSIIGERVAVVARAGDVARIVARPSTMAALAALTAAAWWIGRDERPRRAPRRI